MGGTKSGDPSRYAYAGAGPARTFTSFSTADKAGTMTGSTAPGSESQLLPAHTSICPLRPLLPLQSDAGQTMAFCY